MSRLDPDLLLKAYSVGVFPMADRADAPDVYWVEPRRRGILPLETFHLPRSLAKALKQERFELTANRDFAGVMRGCAEPGPGRMETWINDQIIRAYSGLHARGHAHSLECWQDGRLVGGLYGVELGAAFFGESMFARVTDASKAALAHLVARLRAGGYRLLDCQFLTAHLAQFGAIEIGRDPYRALLSDAVSRRADFFALDRDGAASPPPALAKTVSGPVSGKRIAQFLTNNP
ncbi:MAG: leucyl/phenylalanyl-tRNA--protein transferase [Sphingomonadaceae bacterium]|nr:leucyl/phenylalanyl-tRNA--protein transferase [Sphingomonadaceae bacterium]